MLQIFVVAISVSPIQMYGGGGRIKENVTKSQQEN